MIRSCLVMRSCRARRLWQKEIGGKLESVPQLKKTSLEKVESARRGGRGHLLNKQNLPRGGRVKGGARGGPHASSPACSYSCSSWSEVKAKSETSDASGVREADGLPLSKLSFCTGDVALCLERILRIFWSLVLAPLSFLSPDPPFCALYYGIRASSTCRCLDICFDIELCH